MKAKFINEVHNFKRQGQVFDKIDIGAGPEKFIPIFEKILNLLNIKFEVGQRDSSEKNYIVNDVIEWKLYSIDDELDYYSVYLIKNDKSNIRSGWNATEFIYGYFKNPFDILNAIISKKYGDMENEVKALQIQIINSQKFIKDFEEMKPKIEEARNIIKEYL